jgi:hypothetical protein
VRAWSEAYGDAGLVVIGVHTPEFSFEHDIDGVRRATREPAIDYPLVVDNDYKIWSAFANHSRPALYFADARVDVRDDGAAVGVADVNDGPVDRAGRVADGGASPARSRSGLAAAITGCAARRARSRPTAPRLTSPDASHPPRGRRGESPDRAPDR